MFKVENVASGKKMRDGSWDVKKSVKFFKVSKTVYFLEQMDR